MLLFLFLQRGALMPEPDQMSDPSQVQAPPLLTLRLHLQYQDITS